MLSTRLLRTPEDGDVGIGRPAEARDTSKPLGDGAVVWGTVDTLLHSIFGEEFLPPDWGDFIILSGGTLSLSGGDLRLENLLLELLLLEEVLLGTSLGEELVALGTSLGKN